MSARILIVDDDRVILELASIILRSDGYGVRTAGDGISALTLLDKEPFELVLLDFMMPGKDGLQVLGEIKDKYPDVAVIIFTGMGSEDIAVRAMKSGAADYIMKPFRNHDLLDRTAQVLRSRRLELHNRELLANANVTCMKLNSGTWNWKDASSRRVRNWNRRMRKSCRLKNWRLSVTLRPG